MQSSKSAGVADNPEILEEQEQLAIKYEEEGKIEEAMFLWRQIERDQARYIVAPFHLGMLYRQQHEYEESIKAFQRALTIKPDFSDVYYQLGLVYNDLKMDDDAINMYKAVLQLDAKNRDVHRQLALTYHRNGKIKEATKHYQFAAGQPES